MSGPNGHVAGATGRDPILTEIVRNGLVAITEQMKSNLMRTAYSMIIYEAQDFTVGLFNRAGETISIGIGLPMFVRGMSDTVKAMIRRFGHDGLRDGDVLVTNDAYLTGSHLNHVTFVVPVFVDGAVVGFSACMAHWADIGGALDGMTKDIYSEGLQLPLLKAWDAGRRNDDLMAIIAMNVRIADRAMGDLNAQVAAVRLGARRLLQLLNRHGAARVLDAIEGILDNAAALARERVRAIPDGVYEAESFMDDDGVDQKQRIPMKVRVIVAGERMTIDLSEVSAQVKGFYNSGEASGRACCQVAFKCLTTPLDLPINDCAFRPLDIILPAGRVVSAVRPAPMRWWMTFPMTIVDTIFAALAPALPEQSIAGHHADLLSAALNGMNPADNRFFVLSGGLTGGGWGARHGADGMSATIAMNDGDTHNSPVEQVEVKYPMLIESYRLRDDSGGAGRWQGGLGTEKVVRATAPFNFNAQVDRVVCRPWGLFGGHPGAGNAVAVRAGGRELRFPSGKVLGRRLETGDAYILRAGGGGGYGSPLDRPVEQVAHDLTEGYISAARATGCYGIVFSAGGGIDHAASAAERARRRAARSDLPPDAVEDEDDGTDAGAYLGGGLSRGAMIFSVRCGCCAVTWSPDDFNGSNASDTTNDPTNGRRP